MNQFAKWIHEYDTWPHFTWDEILISSLAEKIYVKQQILFSKMQNIGFDVHRQTTLKILTEDILKSSAIEDASLNKQEVRSSIARRLGLNYDTNVFVGREVEGFSEMMIDAIWKSAVPLTKQRLCDWHSALFPSGKSGIHTIRVGDWRQEDAGPMQVVSGPLGYEKVHFEAPLATRLTAEMETFLHWFNTDSGINAFVKAGIAHLWFVTVHPFEDGNGRIARAVCDMALAKADKIPERFYSLSSQFEAERNDYYAQLELQQRSDTDVTSWLSWFLSCLARALDSSEKKLESVFLAHTIWEKMNSFESNDRQKKIVSQMLEDDFKGFINSSKYAKLAKCSTDTALRDLQELIQKDILVRNSSGGRSTSYRFV